MLTRRSLIAHGLLLGASVAVGQRHWAARPSSAAISPLPVYGPLGPPDVNGIRLPHGFSARLLARSGDRVTGTRHVWHRAPDGGACFPTPDGGWVYVSNSEVANGEGGAAAIRFDAGGAVVDAYPMLAGTTSNCAGGATSWGTWLSCEEHPTGKVFECDPLGVTPAVERGLLGTFRHEAAAEDPATGAIYLSEDQPDGRLYRFIPDVAGDLSAGRLEAARLTGDALSWIAASTAQPDRAATTTAYDGGEGLIVDGRILYFTTKGDHRIWMVALDEQRMTVLFDGSSATTALTEVDNVTVHASSGDVFVAEDGGDMELVQVVRAGGEVVVHPVVQFVGHDRSEVTGPSFDPSGTRLYLSSQRGPDGETGWTIEVTGPFRTTRRPGAASVSGLVTADRLDAIEVGTDG